MVDLSKKTVLIYDHGLYHHVGERLAEDYKEVLYYVPWKSGFPSYERAIIGKGMPGITRIEEFAEHKKEADLIIFPDAGDGSEAADLRDQGFPVVSSGIADMLEYDRIFLKKMLAKVGLPVLPYKVIKGFTNLCKYLSSIDEECYIKISAFRAVTETFKFINMQRAKPHLYKIAFKLGGYAEEMEFIVERCQEGIEPGSDQILCNGYPLETGVYGWEVKGRGYTGKVMKFSDLPEPVRRVDEKLSPVYKKLGANGLSSMETRIGKDLVPFAIDYCGRGGTPSSEVNIRNCKNFSHVMWGIAHGEPVKPEWFETYVAEIILHSDILTDNHCPVDFPDSISKYVALRNAFRNNAGQIFCLPIDGGTMIGGACGWGKTKEAAQEQALEVASKIDCPRLDYDDTVFTKCNKNLKEAEKIGLGGF